MIRNYGSHALFDTARSSSPSAESSLSSSRVIDLNGPTPQYRRDLAMATGRRRQFNLTVLADRTVLANASIRPVPSLVDIYNGVYTA